MSRANDWRMAYEAQWPYRFSVRNVKQFNVKIRTNVFESLLKIIADLCYVSEF